MGFTLPLKELEELEGQVRAALRNPDESTLDVLGYGEVTLVLRIRADGGWYACKRLPAFPTQSRFERYRHCLAGYLDRLSESGLRVADTELWHTTTPDGGVVAYCVQPELPASRLCDSLLHTEDEAWARGFFKRFLDRVDRVVSPALGLDAQAANWADIDGELVYLDITTPLMRDSGGRERLDVRLFFTSLPWLVRDAARVSMSRSIFDKFYDRRGVILDFLGNLHKERLAGLVPVFLEEANAKLQIPITAEEVAAYYRGDARMWEVVQRLRRADRFWQLRVRRRPYPFLLPPAVSR